MRHVFKNSYIKLLTIILCTSLVPLLSFSQGGMHISPGTYIHITTNVDIGGSMENNGQVQNNNGSIGITENYINNFKFTSTGREVFHGPGIQFVYGKMSDTDYLGTLVKANGSDVVLATNTDVYRLQFLTNGTVNLDAWSTTLRVKDSLPSAVSGYSATSSVDAGDNSGKMAWNIGVLNAWYFFPLSNSLAGYRPLAINEFSFGLTGYGYVEVRMDNNLIPPSFYIDETYATGFGNTFPGPCFAGTNKQVFQLNCFNRYGWKLNGKAGHVYVLRSPVPVCDPIGLGPNRILRTNEGSGFFENDFNIVADTILTRALCEWSTWNTVDTIQGGPYNLWGDAGVAGGTGAPLAVELIKFEATAINNSYIEVRWTTASEFQNAYFVLQRSTDGTHFTDIATVQGHGTTSMPNTYIYNDYAVEAGQYYYRLIDISFSGKQTASYVVSAKIDGAQDAFTLMPNPTTGLVFPSSDEFQSIELYDEYGRKLKTFSSSERIFDLSTLATGIYFFRVYFNETDSKVFKHLKQ